MPNRRSLVTRRADEKAPLRPGTGADTDGATASVYDSALRSDFSYIPEDLDPPEAILQARDITHTSIEVSFDPLSIPVDPNFGAPTEIALVRSPSGYPTTLLDGTMVRRHPPEAPDNEGWVRIPDTGLSPGTWYYYGLFAKYEHEGNTHWLRIGQRSILLPAEFLSADHLWERVPEWYRRADMDSGGKPGLLRRVIDTVGYQTDAHRTWAFTVGDVWDAEKISADLLPYLGDTLGQPVEYAAGDERYRALVSRILPLRKLKGTERGTEAYLSSITGYRTRVYSGLNLLPTVNEAEARHTSGLWQNTEISNIARVLSTGSPAGSPAAGRYYLRLSYVGPSSQKPALRLGNGTLLTRMLPVTPGHEIATSAFFRSSFTGAWTVRYRWFDASGVVVGTDTAVFGGIDTTWVRRLAPAVTVPADTAFAELNLELSVNTTIDGLVVEVTDILVADLSWRPEDVPGAINTPPLSSSDVDDQGEYSHEMYYESPRTVHVNVYPQRINYALNSEFSLDDLPVDAWTVAERATWGLLPEAYDSWGDIIDAEPGDSEASWGDLAEGFEPLASTWEIAFDTANKRLVLTPSEATTSVVDDPSHLVPATGTASTPDTADLIITEPTTWVVRLRKNAADDRGVLASQRETTTQNAWSLIAPEFIGLQLNISRDGVANNFQFNFAAAEDRGALPVDEDVYFAVNLIPSAGDEGIDVTAGAYVSTDGIAWAPFGDPLTSFGQGPFVGFDSTAPIRIGTSPAAGSVAWEGQIGMVEQHTGLDPIAGDVIWRFDGADYPGTGTSYTDPRGRTWTLTSAAAMTAKTFVQSYTTQVQSHFVPVVAGDWISAAFVSWATVPDVTIMFSVEFFTNDAPEDTLSIDGVKQGVHGKAWMMSDTPYRYDLRSVQIPEGAAYARIIIETQGTEDHTAYLQQALIENAQVAGTYFNGDEVDAAYGDYFFLGDPHESYSVYYQNYRSFINDAGGDDRITSLMDELLPIESHAVVRTAAGGLY